MGFVIPHQTNAGLNKVQMCEHYNHAQLKTRIQYESRRVPKPFGYTSFIVRNNRGTILAAATPAIQQVL